MIPYIGDFAEDATVYHYFNTFSSNDPSASVTITNLADTDIYVYKDGSVTDLVTDGASVVIDFDARTGVHKLTIDTSLSADYSIGSDYMVLIEGTTVDAGTVTAGIFTFSIENRYNAAADDLANATDGLGALKTLIDTLTTNVATVDTVVDRIEVDTQDLQTQVGTAGAGLTNIGTIATVTNLTNLPTIPTNWITAAGIAADAIGASELAADAVTEIQSGLATSSALATAQTDLDTITGTDGVTLATAQALYAPAKAGDNMGTVSSVTGNVDGNVTGSVGSVTGAVGSVAGNVDGSVASVVGAVGSVTGAVGSVTNDLSKYSGPRGPGVYLNDAAANTNTTSYTDGIISQPVSTIGAAKTIADALSLDRIYLVNDSAIDLTGLTMNDYEFVGIGAPNGNSVALASQDVDGSDFYNLTITGVQGGTARVKFEDCIIGTATLHLHAIRCGFTDAVTGVSFSNNDDNIMDGCYSMVAGNSAPIFICSGANLDISIRHYSGGLELKTLNATATASIEADGQVIFNADCNTGAAVTMRGNLTITDNTGGMSSLTTGAVYDKRADIAAILVDTGTDIPARFDGIEGATFATGTDSLEAIRNRGDSAWTTGAGGTPPQLLQNTTIATLASQTSFTLTAGSADNDAYNGAVVVVTDSATSTQKAVGSVSDYIGASKTITLSSDPGIFTMAAGDTIDIIANASTAPSAAAVRAEIDSNSTQLAAIVADTNDLQTNQGNWLTVTGHATEAKQDIIDTNVDSILVDTGTTIPATIATVDSNVDAILVDTGTTLPATLTTIEGKVDTVDTVADGIQTDLSNATDGLGAIKTDTAAILTDTGTTIPATLTTVEGKIDTVDTNVDAILVDTGTTIPATITTIDTVVDNLNLGIIYGAAATGTLSTTQATTDLTGYTDDQLIGRTIIVTSGVAEGEGSDITDYAETNGTLTFTAMTLAMGNSDTFKIV